jgi:hypothetical protein
MNDRQKTIAGWVATSLTCLYSIGSLISLSGQRRTLDPLLSTLSVELPLSTKLVISLWLGWMQNALLSPLLHAVERIR